MIAKQTTTVAAHPISNASSLPSYLQAVTVVTTTAAAAAAVAVPPSIMAITDVSSPLDNVETTTLIVLIMQEIPEVMEVNSSNSTKSDEEGRNDLIDDKEAEPTRLTAQSAMD
eukprot:g5613.t1 g5613   contig2:912643-912981(+)